MIEQEKEVPRITIWLKEQFKEEIRELKKQGVSKLDITRSIRDALREMFQEGDDAA